MNLSEHVSHALARAAVLLVAAGCVWTLDGLPPTHAWSRVALIALASAFTVSLVLPAHWQRSSLQLGLLAVELVALAALGCALVEDSIPGADARLPFLSAYVVAALVAIVGHRMGAAALGALGGTMVLAVGTALMVTTDWTPRPALLAVEVLLLGATSFLTVCVAGSIKREAQRRELTQHVDRELRQRESAAAELVTFAETLAGSNSLAEIAEAVLRYLRTHSDLDVRAVALESEGEDVALWEEAGRLDAEQVERRRLRMQHSLSHVGSQHVIPRLQCRSSGIGEPASTADFRTAVDIPVRIDGRIVGVFLLADAGPAALEPDRIGVLVDVARRTSEAVRRLERQRDHEHRRTALLLRQMREGVLLLGSDGSVMLANPAAREALEGFARMDGPTSRGPHLGELTLAELADTPPGVSRRFRATIEDPEKPGPTQLACTAISVMDRSRRIGTLVTLSDVTDEELARNRVVQAEKMTLVGQTLAGVAHELNNPLAALIGYADLLRDQELPADVAKPVQSMRDQAVRATRIVRNLLNFARRRNPERMPTAVRDLVDGTVELFAYEARLAGVDLQVEVDEDLPRVLGDKHALQQVLVNLVQNGLHALEDWDGERRLTLRGTTVGEQVTLTVTDSGPGVPESLRSRIFESFFTTKGSSKGTGLGLALSRSIAQDHGGDLLLAADTGGGAAFTLRLPRLRRDGAAAGPTRSVLDEGFATPQHVLVVDDEASVRETLVAQLGTMGSRVDSAASIQEALRMTRERRYDALIVDLRMPGGSGLDLHQELVEHNPFLADRVVFITGDFVNDELLCRALDTGRLLLEKPFTMRELAVALGKTLRGALGGRLSA